MITYRGIMYLSAVAAGSKAEAVLSGIQKNLFSRWGLSSALALPPVLPLRLQEGPHDERLMASACSLARRPLRLIGLARLGRVLFAEIDPPTEQEEVRRLLGSPQAAYAVGPGLDEVAAAPGFYLAFVPPGHEAPEVRELGPFEPLEMRATSLVDIRLDTFPGIGPWWEAIAWEYEFEKRMKKRA